MAPIEDIFIDNGDVMDDVRIVTDTLTPRASACADEPTELRQPTDDVRSSRIAARHDVSESRIGIGKKR